MGQDERRARERYERGMQLLTQAEEELNRGHDLRTTARAELAMKHTNAKYEKLKETLARVQEVNRNDQLALSQATSKLTSDERADRSEAKCNEALQDVRKARQQVDELRQDVDKMKAEIAQLKHERDQAKLNVDKISRDRDFIAAQLDIVTSGRNEDVRLATEAQEKHSEAWRVAETAKMSAERAQKVAETAAQEMKVECSEMTSKLEDASVRARALVEDLEAATGRADRSEVKVAILEGTIKRLEQESASSKVQLAEFSAFIQQLAELITSRHGFAKGNSGDWERLVQDMVTVERIVPACQPVATWTIGQPWISGTQIPVAVSERLYLDDLLCRLFGRALMDDCQDVTIMEFAELVKELSSTNRAVPVSMVGRVLEAWLKRVDTMGSSILCAMDTAVAVLQYRWRNPALISHVANSVQRNVSMADLDVQIVAALVKMSRSDRENLLPSSGIAAKINLGDALKQVWPTLPPGIYWANRQCGAIIGDDEDLWLFDCGDKVIWKAAKSSFKAPAPSDKRLDPCYRFDGPGNKSFQIRMTEALSIISFIGTGN